MVDVHKMHDLKHIHTDDRLQCFMRWTFWIVVDISVFLPNFNFNIMVVTVSQVYVILA